jgi:hypothetical protein
MKSDAPKVLRALRFGLAIVFVSVLIAQKLFAHSCALQQVLPGPAGNTELDDISWYRKAETKFKRQSLGFLQTHQIAALGEIQDIDEPIGFEWHSARLAAVKIDRYFKAQTGDLGPVLRVGQVLPIMVDETFKRGDRIVFFANMEWPQEQEERVKLSKKSPSTERIWLARQECYEGAYRSGTYEFEFLLAQLSSFTKPRNQTGQLFVGVQAARNYYQSTSEAPELDGDLKVKIRRQNSNKIIAEIGDAESIELAAGNYVAEWPQVSGFGVDCEWRLQQRSTLATGHRCSFKIGARQAYDLWGVYRNFAEPIVHIRDQRGRALLTTAQWQWFQPQAEFGWPARTGNDGYAPYEYPPAATELRAVWMESEDSRTPNCKLSKQQYTAIGVAKLRARKPQLLPVFKLGITEFETRIDPRDLDWVPVQFEGDLDGETLVVDALCDVIGAEGTRFSTQTIQLQKLPATVYVPKGQVIRYGAQRCCHTTYEERISKARKIPVYY